MTPRTGRRPADGSRSTRRNILVGTVALAGTIAMGAAPRFARELAARPAPGPDDVLAFFDKIALTRRDAGGNEYDGWVRKWTGPVTIRIRGAPDASQRAGLWSIIATVSRCSGLAFRVTGEDVAGGNRIDLHFLDHAEMAARYGAGGPVCHCRTFGNNGALHTGKVEISTLFSDCLGHEFMHALGCDNHWAGPGATAAMPSVLALRHAPARSPRFTECDELAIRALYDARLAPRTPRADALPIAREFFHAAMAA